jgi:uncharacterized protein (UPF0248 family)
LPVLQKRPHSGGGRDYLDYNERHNGLMGNEDLMRKSHQILLKIRYDPRYSFDSVRVWYVNRGAPGDCSYVDGNQIQKLEAYYLEIAAGDTTTCIPYHRIRKILYENTVVWER